MSKAYEEMKVEKWVDIEDVMEYLDISKRTALIWIKNGKLPAYKAGKKYKLKLSEVDEWLRAGKMKED